jgi:hypothetical protein
MNTPESNLSPCQINYWATFTARGDNKWKFSILTARSSLGLTSCSVWNAGSLSTVCVHTVYARERVRFMPFSPLGLTSCIGTLLPYKSVISTPVPVSSQFHCWKLLIYSQSYMIVNMSLFQSARFTEVPKIFRSGLVQDWIGQIQLSKRKLVIEYLAISSTEL